METVVAFEGFEAAFDQEFAGFGVAVDAQAFNRVDVGTHVRLADELRAHAERAQVVAKRPLIDAQRDVVPGGAMRAHVGAGVGRHARGAADRRLHVGAVETYAARGKRVDVRRGDAIGCGTGEIVPAHLVGHDEEHVARGTAHGGGLAPVRRSNPRGIYTETVSRTSANA